MSYLDMLKIFYDRLLSVGLSSGQIALWHAFVEINNREGWSEWFDAPISTLCILSGLSRSGVIKGIPILVEKKYIDVCKNRYRLCTQKCHNQEKHIYKKTRRDETKLNETKRKDFSSYGLSGDFREGSDDISARLE